MQHLKDQLEQQTRMTEANTHQPQEELRKIEEQTSNGPWLRAADSGPGLNFDSIHLSSGNSFKFQQLVPINIKDQVIHTN
ncbi:hypothetical protein GH733_016060 [Mirounga leonina]|nr:hypothetical protein GH733_016060 [Mirounga leonina]